LSEICSGGVGTIAEAGLEQRFTALCGKAARHRGFGDFWGHMLVAQGSMDVMLDPVVNVWDLAALKIIVEEAGGTMTSVSGEDRIDGGSALTTNGNLHDDVLEALKP
jgi:histidinol-phosphatase